MKLHLHIPGTQAEAPSPLAALTLPGSAIILAALALLPGPALFLLALAAVTGLAVNLAAVRRHGAADVPPLPMSHEH